MKKAGGVSFDVETEYKFIEAAGQKMGVILVVVQLRCDMPAWAFGSGLRSWGHKEFPCSCCKINKKNLCSPRRVPPLTSYFGIGVELGRRALDRESAMPDER